jgi:hypothetical protein
LSAKRGDELPIVYKAETDDFVCEQTTTNRFLLDKPEGFTFDASDNACAVTDNDGVDGPSGETLFFPVNLVGIN